MKSEIYLVLLALSTGWGLRASLESRFCLRCAKRTLAMRAMKFSQRKMPQFLQQLIGGAGLLSYGLFAVQDFAREFGWKWVFKCAQSLLKGYMNANTKIKDVPRSSVR